MSTTFLTKKRSNSSSAQPELANKNGKRALFVNEPEHDDVINVGSMKGLTGMIGLNVDHFMEIHLCTNHNLN